MSETASEVLSRGVWATPKRPFIDRKASKAFGGWLRQARKRKRLTLRAAADAIGVTESYFYKLEIGERTMLQRPDWIVKLSDLLGLDPNEMRERMHARTFDIHEALPTIERMAGELKVARVPDDPERERFYHLAGRRVLEAVKDLRELFEAFEVAPVEELKLHRLKKGEQRGDKKSSRFERGRR